jgi:hypothetical protein
VRNEGLAGTRTHRLGRKQNYCTRPEAMALLQIIAVDMREETDDVFTSLAHGRSEQLSVTGDNTVGRNASSAVQLGYKWYLQLLWLQMF